MRIYVRITIQVLMTIRGTYTVHTSDVNMTKVDHIINVFCKIYKHPHQFRRVDVKIFNDNKVIRHLKIFIIYYDTKIERYLQMIFFFFLIKWIFFLTSP